MTPSPPPEAEILEALASFRSMFNAQRWAPEWVARLDVIEAAYRAAIAESVDLKNTMIDMANKAVERKDSKEKLYEHNTVLEGRCAWLESRAESAEAALAEAKKDAGVIVIGDGLRVGPLWVENCLKERDEARAEVEAYRVKSAGLFDENARLTDLLSDKKAVIEKKDREISRLVNFHVPPDHEHETGTVNPDGDCWVCALIVPAHGGVNQDMVKDNQEPCDGPYCPAYPHSHEVDCPPAKPCVHGYLGHMGCPPAPPSPDEKPCHECHREHHEHDGCHDARPTADEKGD